MAQTFVFLKKSETESTAGVPKKEENTKEDLKKRIPPQICAFCLVLSDLKLFCLTFSF